MSLTFSKDPQIGAASTAMPPSPESSKSPARKPKRAPLVYLSERVFGKVLAITRQKLEVIMEFLGPRILWGEAIPVSCDDGYGEDDSKGYAIENGIATLPIRGTLVKRSSGMSSLSGLSGYEALAEQFQACLDDPDVKGILFDVDSPGGESDGMFDLADAIYQARGQKPMIAICNDQMCSAAYAISSSADSIYTTRTGMVGSIGCYMLHVDQSGMDEQRGLKYTYIAAGDKKVEGNPHEPLDDGAKTDMLAEVARIRDMFVSLVARNRAVPAQALLDTQAGVYYAEAAIPLLADRLGTLDDATRDLCARCGVDPDQDDDDDCDPDDPNDPCHDDDDESACWNCGVARGLHLDIGTPLPACIGIVEPSLEGSLFRSRKHKRQFPRFSRQYHERHRNCAIQAGAIPPHKTSTSNGSWDGPANEARLKSDQTRAYYSKAYAWIDPQKDATKKNAYKFIHHEVSGAGDVGAANVTACRSGIGVLNGARGGTTIPAADRKGVYDHLAKHLRDAGVTPPDLKSESESLAFRSASETDGSLDAVAGAEFLQSARQPMGNRLLAECLQFKIEHYYQCAVRKFTASKALAGPVDRKISMLVVPYGVSADLGGFREVYQRGCFSQGLDKDPRALFNHDEGCVLGRQSAGTAVFTEDADGVHVECDAPETGWANDLLVSMRRGDITQASAAFFILQYHWETRNGERIRVIEKALLREASVHAFPAYETTQASVPPAPENKQSHAVEHELDRARLELLRLGYYPR